MKFQYLISIILIFSILCGCNHGSTSATGNNGLAACALAGGMMKSSHVDPNKKYKRKDCPVCKGKGWYMSGDGIEKIECQYCEPESSTKSEKSLTIIKR